MDCRVMLLKVFMWEVSLVLRKANSSPHNLAIGV
ncbi:hypothetical protein PanWU01x14_040360 [Parasponia andersonii]|uniref:Uncharacterized protein n=1 Tax=Parasponia andersonii TaxID=3476 RepID=A0A2P5DR60_PARAD|nr:hypothetical protein PanWU01x14_040360 [Parasponia andersonii]